MIFVSRRDDSSWKSRLLPEILVSASSDNFTSFSVSRNLDNRKVGVEFMQLAERHDLKKWPLEFFLLRSLQGPHNLILCFFNLSMRKRLIPGIVFLGILLYKNAIITTIALENKDLSLILLCSWHDDLVFSVLEHKNCDFFSPKNYTT